MAQPEQPIIINLGKLQRKQVKKLKKGQGKAIAEVEQATEHLRASLGSDGEGKVILPVVIVYEKKRRKRRRGLFSGL